MRERSLYSLADNLFRVGKSEEARETWKNQVKEFPRGGKADIAFYRLGTAAFSKGRIDEAAAYYRQALEVSKDREIVVKAKYSLAECMEAAEDLKGALTMYKELEPVYQNKEALRIKIRALETRIIKKSY